VIGEEVSSMESCRVYAFIARAPEEASMIKSYWAMGSQLLVDNQTHKWNAQQADYGEQQQPGDYVGITSPVHDSPSVPLVLCRAARHDLEITTLSILTFLPCCPVHETVSLCLPENGRSIGSNGSG
jgi:hypothetical protein